ncbi:MAG: hypothetical protein JXA77_11660 [Bacteroidales bacterium]|nr:hypothetical protein [Bacteroidales bacterium]MBN2818691.1 hypothetical protein [Bacteroidales bacterium]
MKKMISYFTVFLEKPINFFARFLPYPEQEKPGEFEYWKSKLLFILLVSFLVFGTVAYIPSLIYSIITKEWIIAALDTFAYLVLIFLCFNKSLSKRNKSLIILGNIYILGIVLIIVLGPFGAGFTWLFLFTIFTGLLLDFRSVIYSTLIIFISLCLLTILIIPDFSFYLKIMDYTPATWLINVVNFVIANFLASVSLSVIVTKIYESLEKETQLINMLEKEKKNLKDEKFKAEESDRLKSAFVANISHEIRTPMNGIMGFAELLKNPNITLEKHNKYVQLIKNSGEKMLGIINDLIDISKIEAGQVDISISEIQIMELIDELIEFFTPQATRKGLFLKHTKTSDCKGFVIKSDKLKLNQILSNLINNAIKFTDRGGVTLMCKINQSDVQFVVKDTGPGINAEEKIQIFERFQQLERIFQPTNDGVGLGLAISKVYAQMLQGRLWVESEPLKGSEFYIEIPFEYKHKQ